MRNKIIATLLVFMSMLNLLFISTIIMQDNIIDELQTEHKQLTWDLNVSQTAFSIAKSPYYIQHSPYCSDSWVLK